MNETTGFLVKHGLPLVFGVVFLEQMGLPLPALPFLLAAGALCAAGSFSLLWCLTGTIIACLAADSFWFWLGRFRGNQVLGLLCRISLEPDSCVRRTQNVFARYGMRSVLVSKFVPGFSTVAPPLAGMSGVGIGRFLFVDGLGSLLYGICLLGLGYLFSHQVGEIVVAVNRFGLSALSVILALVAGYIAYKYWHRRRLLHQLRTARITPAELREKLDAGQTPLILDLRSSTTVGQDPVVIRGAIHLSMAEIEARQGEFARDQEIVVYCSCPNEVSSARVALWLQRRGFTRVRPLLGGIDAWKALNGPVEQWVRALAAPIVLGSASAEPAPVKVAPGPVVATGDSSRAAA